MCPPRTRSKRPTKTFTTHLFLICAPLIPSFSYADGLVLEVIPLHHRSSSTIAPMVRGFIAKGGTIKAADDKLMVRTNPSNLKELRKLVAKLDVPLRHLLITVRQLSGERARRAGTVGELRVWQTENSDDANRTQQVQVLEGKEAFIDVGREIPISDFAVSQSQTGTIFEQKTRYIGATTGFSVRPHLDGDTVNIDITATQKRQSGVASPPEFETQAVHTTASGKLGEWITIGASAARERTPGIIDYSTSKRDEQDRRTLLRVTMSP